MRLYHCIRLIVLLGGSPVLQGLVDPPYLSLVIPVHDRPYGEIGDHADAQYPPCRRVAEAQPAHGEADGAQRGLGDAEVRQRAAQKPPALQGIDRRGAHVDRAQHAAGQQVQHKTGHAVLRAIFADAREGE